MGDSSPSNRAFASNSSSVARIACAPGLLPVSRDSGSPSICPIRSHFSYFSRILRQCCHVTGSPRLTAAKESTASVESRRSGSSATTGSSSRRNSRASSTAMLRDDWPAALISSEPGDQLPGLGPVAASAKRLKVRLFGLAPLADRNNVIHFQVNRPPASSTSSSVAHQHRRAHAVGHAPVCKAVLPARLFHRGEVDELGERAQV